MFEEMMMSEDTYMFIRELPELLEYMTSMSNERSESLGRQERAEPSGEPELPMTRNSKS